MLKGIVESRKIICPICGGTEKKVFRRSVVRDGFITMICRCLRCDQIYEYDVDKAGQAVGAGG
jgi:hypothetical protein